MLEFWSLAMSLHTSTAENSSKSIIPTSQKNLWQDLLPGGCHWSMRIRRGTLLRFTAQSAGANLSALFFNAEEILERYNAPDTLKAQHTAFLTRGHVCYSDMGRILCSIVTDSAGWNDAFCGVSDAEQIAAQYGVRDFGAARNDMYRSGREGLLIELGKYLPMKQDNSFGSLSIVRQVTLSSCVLRWIHWSFYRVHIILLILQRPISLLMF
jgi:hypothetical protein